KKRRSTRAALSSSCRTSSAPCPTFLRSSINRDTRPSRLGFHFLNQPGVQGDGYRGEGLGHRAALLGFLCFRLKFLLVDAGNFGVRLELDERNAESAVGFIQVNLGRGTDPGRRKTGLRQTVGERHGKASGMRRADELLRIGAGAGFKS